VSAATSAEAVTGVSVLTDQPELMTALIALGVTSVNLVREIMRGNAPEIEHVHHIHVTQVLSQPDSQEPPATARTELNLSPPMRILGHEQPDT
jgi:hypothetical protein